MTTHPARRGWSYAEFARLPDDGNRSEVIDGELFVTPSPRPLHQELVGRLVELPGPFVRRHGIGRLNPGPIDVLFGVGDYLTPDLVFVQRANRDQVTDRGVECAPDLVVEVVSPSTAFRDRSVTRDRYLLFGVPEYWVVDLQHRVEIHHPEPAVPNPRVVASGTFSWRPVPDGPALEIDVDALFGELD